MTDQDASTTCATSDDDDRSAACSEACPYVPPRFEIAERLAAGGMGIVYRAVDRTLARTVALKWVAPGDRRDRRRNERLLYEARAAAVFVHPHAAAVFDAVETADGSVFVVMEYVAGRTLRARLAGSDLPPVPTRMEWLVAIAQVLAAMHRLGLAHGDVKPENVIVRHDGLLKVVDFGMARVAPTDLDPTADTLAHALVEGASRVARGGTPGYMAPEQLGGRPPDAKSDQFAWGVLANELLEGAEVAPEIRAIVARAVHPDPAARYSSMHAIVAEMHVAPKGTSTSGASTSEKRPPRRGLGWYLSRAIGVAALGAFALAARPRAAPQPLLVATQPPRAGGPQTETPARTAYRMALQSLRDCSYEPAVEQLERATQLDPSFASAHLRRVLVARPDEDVRQHFSDALALRGMLSDHERALLDAYVPWIRASPDLAESERRLLALALRERSNAETYYFLGKVRFFSGNFEGAIEAYETAVKLDPELLPAIRMRAFALVSLGRGDEAAAGYQECIRRSPTAASCVRESLELEGLEGRCEAALALGRKLIAMDPSSAASYELLAVLLEASGESEASVRTALAEAAARMPPDQIASRQGELEGSLAVMKGRFTEAAEGFRRADVASDESPQETRREHMMSLRVDLALDMGDRRLAGEIARGYLARRAAWIPHPEFDPSIIAWAALYRAGEIGHDELDRLRREWLRPQPTRQNLEPGLQWSFAFAAPVVTDRDAQEAVAALEHYLPLPGAWVRGANHDAWIGTAFARGGRPDDAVVYLTRSARSCFAWYYPMEAMHAANVLGDTLAAKGDIAGACDAYGRILRRWRAARPQSALFHRARARSEQLGCPE